MQSSWYQTRGGWEEASGMESDKLTRHSVIGTLKGYDQLMNLVLDEVKEAMTGSFMATSEP